MSPLLELTRRQQPLPLVALQKGEEQDTQAPSTPNPDRPKLPSEE